MEKQILMEFMQNNCVSFEKRLTGREIEQQTGISYKRISDYFLNDLSLNVINYSGYFIPTKEDVKILNSKLKNLKLDYMDINNRVWQCERIIEELSEDKLF